MFKISGFADEMAESFAEQLAACKRIGLEYVELRGVDGKNIIELTDSDISRCRDMLAAAKISVSSIGSPVGKVGLAEPRTMELERLDRAIELARAFDTGFIRIFSFYLPEGATRESSRDSVVKRLADFASRAEAAPGIVLVLENEREIYGESAVHCRELLDAVPSRSLMMNLDPGNFVLCGVKVFPDAYQLLADRIAYLHIKDATRQGEICLPGQGDGDIGELLAAVAGKQEEIFISLEPHLAAAGKFAGFSGEKLFAEALQSLRKLVADLPEQGK
jgi:3-dehydroshikimate dehydratase